MKLSQNLKNLKLLPCVPPIWARDGNTQTLLGHFIPSWIHLEEGERQEILLPDGDRLVGFLLRGTSDKIVYLFHGLTGSTEAGYIQRTAKLCRGLGHSVFLVNHRGCGVGVGLAQHPYHSGRAEDLSAVIEFGRNLFPRQKHLAIGFSLSGNALLLLLTGVRGKTPPDFAISVNAPIDLKKSAVALSQGINRIYDFRFVYECRKEVRQRGKNYKIPLFATLQEFDSIYTAPEGNFKSREDYYESCSTKNILSKITTPTIMLTAKDDPIVSCQDYLEAQLSPSIHLHVEPHGGHLGYLSKRKMPFGNYRWMDYALNEFIQGFFRETPQSTQK